MTARPTDALPPALLRSARGCALAWRAHEDDAPEVAWQVMIARAIESPNLGVFSEPGKGGLVVPPPAGRLWPEGPMLDLTVAALDAGAAVILVFPDALRAQMAHAALRVAAAPPTSLLRI